MYRLHQNYSMTWFGWRASCPGCNTRVFRAIQLPKSSQNCLVVLIFPENDARQLGSSNMLYNTWHIMAPDLFLRWILFIQTSTFISWNHTGKARSTTMEAQQRGWRIIPGSLANNWLIRNPGWWYTYPSETFSGRNPSEKYEFVSWDYDIPNIRKNNPNVPKHQPVSIYWVN